MQHPVQRAAMPEAAVNKHRDMGNRESQVGLTRQAGHETETQARAPQCLAQYHFWSRTRALDAGHQAASLGLLRDCLIHGLVRRCGLFGTNVPCNCSENVKVYLVAQPFPRLWSGLRYLHRPANLEDVLLKLTGWDLRD